MEAVSVRERIARLQSEHRNLDKKILSQIQAFQHDQLEVQRLKKRKLLVKDQIAALEASLIPDVPA
ncbi:MAG: DUF465 domain-containing protein [Betaproteobacteria bacterium]|nr:DUF465 domain-containing protein [Betaproteobacteria bacterium]MDE2622284.1 DUF465 domain-containing protein [Betaproteobacteria bacterium]